MSSSMSKVVDARLDQLSTWIADLFGDREFDIAPASADASFRRYFRVQRGKDSWIAMDAPPDKEDMEPYVRVAAMLVAVGVNAPRVTQRDAAQGFLLNSDLGSRTYLAELESGGDADRLYRDAIQALVRMQQGAGDAARSLPPYDAALLRRELALFPEWFCQRHLQIELDAAAHSALASATEALLREALAQPCVFVHRDYHSRNLMVTDNDRYGANPGILDFQDAVFGPVTYDLVSLLRDCYIAWPLERVHGWMREFRSLAQSAGIEVGESEAQFLRWFDFMGVQRHMKAIGIFARLWHRDGKAGYLKDIPRTLNYVREVCRTYDELHPLHAFIETLPTHVVSDAQG